MSTMYTFLEVVKKDDVIKAAGKVGLKVADSEHSNETQFCLTDGESYIWFYNDEDGNVEDIGRYGKNTKVKTPS